jgi:hypothetical protein
MLNNVDATRLIVTTVGVLFGLFSGVNHGFFEFLHGNKPTSGLIIQAIGEAQRFWPRGTGEALTIIPNYMVTGIISMILGITIVIWSIWFLPRPHGPAVFLSLFILLFLCGGGIGQVVFFIPAWAFATRMHKPLVWWRKVIPHSSWLKLSKLWIIMLSLATIALLIGLEMAIYGYFPGLADPARIQNTSMLFILSAAVLFVLSFITGFSHELMRMETSWVATS